MNSSADTGHAGTSHHLLRILGVGFGLAIVIGGTVGVGILRSPGPITEQLGSVWLIMFAWVLGGVYALLGANYLCELATMVPKAGGYFVYAHRAYGSFGGFVVGWSDFIYNNLALAYIAVVFGEYSVSLFGMEFPGARVLISVSVLLLLSLLNVSHSSVLSSRVLYTADRPGKRARSARCRPFRLRRRLRQLSRSCSHFNLYSARTTDGIRESTLPKRTRTRDRMCRVRCLAE